MQFRFRKYPVGIAACLVMSGMLIPGHLCAQTDSGRVLGSVTDQSGAIVPGATITVVNTQNNSTLTAKSDAGGNFAFNALHAGNYQATVQETGFASQEQNFILDVSQVQALNFKLAVGDISTTVQVTDAAPLVQTETSNTGLVITGRELSDLPLNGRNFTQLALLAPGVTRGAYGNQASGSGNNAETLRYNDTGGASLSGNGLQPQANNFLYDGLDNNEGLVNTINFFPPVEAMSEFRVTNSLAPAEFGRAGGVIIQAQSKSGTNSIHGSAFIFYRDSGLANASPNYFNPQIKSPNYHRNQFGGTLGLPLIKDKLFIFGDYQGLRENIPNGGATINTVPTAQMRVGDFTELLGQGQTVVPYNSLGNFDPTGCTTFTLADGRKVNSTSDLNYGAGNTGGAFLPDSGAIFDPLTCKQFGTAAAPNIIPTDRLNPIAVKYLNAFPLPNRPATSGTLNDYANQQYIVNKYNDFDVRLDYHFKTRDLLFVRYSYGQDNDTKTVAIVGLPSGFGAGSNDTHPRGIAAGETHTFSPNIVNEFRFGYSRPLYGYKNPFGGEPFSANLGIPNANRSALLGGGALIGGSNSQISYTGDGGPYSVPQHSWQYVDNISIARGKHSLKFGGSVLFRHVDFFQADYRSKGFFQIQNGGGDYTGYEVSELLAGFVNTYSIANPLGFYKTRTYEDGFFAQDDWKITPRLSLNLGLRYDLYNFPYEENNRQSNFNVLTGALDVAGKNGNSRSLVHTPKTNFGPRVGFAFDPWGDGKTVLRGGYGRYFFLDRGGVGNELENNPDFNGASAYSDYAGYRITLSGAAPGLQPNSPIPGPYAINNSINATSPLPSSGATVNEAAPTNASVISYPVNSKLPTVQQVNLAVQQELGPNTTVTIAYVGTKADHLLTPLSFSAGQVGTGTQFFHANGLNVTQELFEGTSHYNGLQTSLNRRLVHGLQLTAAYTWSHNIDDAAGPFQIGSQSGVPVTARGPNLKLNRGNADNDQRHAATFSALIEVPYGRGRRYGAHINRGLDYLIGGFQLSPFVSIGSGTPFDLAAKAANNVSVRPDQVGISQVGLRKDYANVAQGFIYLNRAAFADAPLSANGSYARVGNIGRNHFYGPGYNTTGLSVFKDLPITERVNTQIRVQAYNLFNHPQFGNLSNTNIDNGVLSINTTRFRSERELEFAYRVTF